LVARLIITALVVEKQTVAQVAARFGGPSPMSHEWDPDISEALKPWAYRSGDIGQVAGVFAGMAMFAGILFAGFEVNDWIGLNTPETQDTLADNVFGVVVFSLCCVLSVLTYMGVVRLLDR
jgi:hypothetical protein